MKLEEGEEVVFADSFDAKEKVFAEVQGRKIELSKLTKKKRDAKPEQVSKQHMVMYCRAASER